METITHHERTVEGIMEYIKIHFKDNTRYKTIVDAYAKLVSSDFDSVFNYVRKDLLGNSPKDAAAFGLAFGDAADEKTSDSNTSIKDGDTGNQSAADARLSFRDRWSQSSHSTTWYLQFLPGTKQLKEEPRSLVTQGSTEEPEPESRWSSSTDSQRQDEQ
jgi:hypothetical protein